VTSDRLWRALCVCILPLIFVVLTACESTASATSLTPVATSAPDNKNIAVWVYRVKSDQTQELFLEGASVFLSGTFMYDTYDYEGYYLDDCPPGQFIVASAPGYIIEKTACAAGQRDYSISLHPLLSKVSPDYSWVSAGAGGSGCSVCHSDNAQRNEYNEWRVDGHSTVFSEPYFWTMYMGMDVNRNPGTPTNWQIISTGQKIREKNDSVFGPGYLLDYAEAEANCANCHAPATVHGTQRDSLAGLIHGFGTYSVDARLEGITCDICHKVTSVDLNAERLPYSERPGILSMSFVSASFGEHFAVGPRARLLPPAGMRVACSSIFSEGQFCAACHYGKFFDTVIYNSYGEWLASDYSKKQIAPDGFTKQENPGYRSCQDCHMLSEAEISGKSIKQRSACVTDEPTIENFSHNMMKYESGQSKYNPKLAFVPKLIEDAAKLVVLNEYDANTNSLRLVTQVTNERAGHKLPTDSPLRHLILVVEARDEVGNLLPLVAGETIPNWGGIGLDTGGAMGNYGGLPGKIYANVLADRDTNESPTAAYWNPTRHLFEDIANGKSSDTRLAPHQTDEARFSFAVPAAGKVSVSVKVVYRYAFIELAKQKGWYRPDVIVTQTRCTVDPFQIIAHECKSQ
jgi:hypothetical protein